MRILITGGAGFIGQHVAVMLASEHELVAVDSLNAQVHQHAEAAVQRFPGQVVIADVSQASTWDALPGFDVVVHLAAETGTAQSMYEAERYRAVNVEGTRLAAAAAASGGAALVALSSRAVYGEGRYECRRHGTRFGGRCCPQAEAAPSREEDPHRPVSVYGETKSEAEAILAEYAAAIPVTVLRPQNVVGFGQALHNPYTGVLAAFLARLREGRPLSVYGDGSATRDFVHVDDVARLITWCIDHPGRLGSLRVLNCGTGERTSLTDLARFAAAAAPVASAPVEYVDVGRAGDIEHAVASLEGLRSAGAPLPLMSSEQAVADFIGRSWGLPGADSEAWDVALRELRQRGLTS